MKNGLWAILIGLAAAAIVYFAAAHQVKGKMQRLYDGQVQLQADLSPETMDIQAIKRLLSGRLSSKNIKHDITLPGQNRLQIAAKGIADTSDFIQSLVFNGKLEILECYPTSHPAFGSFTQHFDELSDSLEPAPVNPPPVKEKKEALTSEVTALLDSISEEQTSSAEKSHFARYFDLIHSQPPAIGAVKASDTIKVMRILNDLRFREHIPVDMLFRWGPNSNYSGRNGNVEFWQLFALQAVPLEGRQWISNADITDARSEYDAQGRPVVVFELNADGAKKWEWLTRKNTGKYLAIIVSNTVHSAPIVESAISGGNVQITGNFTLHQATSLADMISSPYLPVSLQVQSAVFTAYIPSQGARQLLWPLIVFLVLGVTAYFILNSLNFSNKNNPSPKK